LGTDFPPLLELSPLARPYHDGDSGSRSLTKFAASVTTQLAHGKINNADTLTVELIQPPDMPPVIRLRWPEKPLITTPDAYANVAAGIMQILAAAVVAAGHGMAWFDALSRSSVRLI
jgi:hypothetical protein